jgi:Spy/CpxP family protein refolding chaperone
MFRRTLIISSLVLLLAAAVAYAQGRQFRGGRDRGFSPQRLEHLQKELGLNESQLSGIRALDENRRKEMEPLRQELRQKKQTLRQMMEAANPNPADVGNATLSLKDTRERARDINQRFMSGLKGLLTPEQQQKLPKRFSR